MRRSQVWCMKPSMAVQQFKTCVMPALEYGVAIWGSSMYTSHVWSQVEIFWRSVARCILGTSVRTPNASVYGELGWYPFWVRAAYQAVSFWTRATEMPNDSILKQAMFVQRDLVSKGKSCWLNSLKHTLCSRSICGEGLWNKWWSNISLDITCSRPEMANTKCTEMVRWEEDCQKSFHAHAFNAWYDHTMMI